MNRISYNCCSQYAQQVAFFDGSISQCGKFVLFVSCSMHNKMIQWPLYAQLILIPCVLSKVSNLGHPHSLGWIDWKPLAVYAP